MKEELKLLGSQSHGTKLSIANNQNVEYSIHINWDEKDKHYKRWIEKYKQDTNLGED